MKKLILLKGLCLLCTVFFAQAPQKMTYQAVIRNNTNALLVNKPVGMKISILQGSTTGVAVYEETHTPTTNSNGLASLEIGLGSVLSGQFSSIDWQKGPYFIKTETDPNGEKNYNITSVSQLLSVPYALYAERAHRADTALVALSGKQNNSSIEFPTGNIITFTLTNQWQTMDLSPVVGKGKCYIQCRVTNYHTSIASAEFHTKGDPYSYQPSSNPSSMGANSYESGIVALFTNENGLVEYRCFGNITPVMTLEVIMVLR